MSTRARTKQAIEVMQAWLDGAEIEEYVHNSFDEVEDIEPDYVVCSPSWDWRSTTYRVQG